MKSFFIFLLASFQAFILFSQDTNESKFLVKPYLQFSSQTSIYILWETTEGATSRVDYGEARYKVEKAILDRNVSPAGNRMMHEIFLPDLKPETNYFWQTTSITSSGDTVQSEVLSFKTSVKDSSSYMFALVGDSQRNNNTPWAWGKIAQKVWEDRPNFVVHAGDIVETGLDKKDWLDNFFPQSHQLMSRIPMYTVLGNHEQDAPYYYQYVVAPKPEFYYTFRYGNAQFFMIDSNRDLEEGSEQYEWLEWELAKSKATWKIAVHHHPPYSSDSDDHGNTYKELSTLGTESRNLVPLYERYGLDFCLFGHTHLFERSWPIKDNMINMQDGVVYINSGGAGGNLEDFTPSRNWFTMELQSVHHYCTFSVFENNIIFKAIDHEGRMFDAFQMQKKSTNNQQASILLPPAVHILTDATLFQDQSTVNLEPAFENLEIRYTIDGTEPTRKSLLYNQPLNINQTTLLTTRAYTTDGRASRITKLQLRKMQPQAAMNVKKTEKGLQFSYYEGEWKTLPDFSSLKSMKRGISQQANLEQINPRADHFAVVLEGLIEVSATGLQTFFLNSDDGSKMYINDVLIIDHDGDHSAIKKTGQTILAEGKHKIRIEYLEVRGSQFLQAGMMDGNLGAVPFTPFQFSH